MTVNLENLVKSIRSLLGKQQTLNFLLDESRTKHIRDYQDELVKVSGLIDNLEKAIKTLKKYKEQLDNTITKSTKFAKTNKLLTDYGQSEGKEGN